MPHQAGQHLPIRLSLPGTDKPVIRTYTLSVAPSDAIYRISVKRDGVVSQHLHDAIKVGDAYTAFMDKDRIERLDAQPLAADLAVIQGEKTRSDIAAVMGRGVGGFQVQLFGVAIGADAKTPTRYAVHMGTGGLGLPDRDYYLQPQFAEKKTAYLAYVTRMLGLIDWPDADGCNDRFGVGQRGAGAEWRAGWDAHRESG